MAPHLAGRGQERGEYGDNGNHEEPCDNESCEGPAGEARLDQWPYDVRLVGLVSHHVSIPLFVACPIRELSAAAWAAAAATFMSSCLKGPT